MQRVCHLMLLTVLGGCAAAGTAGHGAQPSGTAAQWTDSARRLIDAGVIRENRALVGEGRALAERALTQSPGDPLLLHYQGYALYREAGLAWDGDEAMVPPLLREAERLLSQSLERRPLAETAALLARIQGYMSALYPRLAADLGAKARGYRAEAERLGSGNPRVWLLRGQGSFYTPELHGGGMTNAEQQLGRAVDLFREDAPPALLPSWGKAETYAWLGQLYARSGRVADARAAYEMALELEPDYAWARDSLRALAASVPGERQP